MRKGRMVETLEHISRRLDLEEHKLDLEIGRPFVERIRECLEEALEHVPDDPMPDGFYAATQFSVNIIIEVRRGVPYYLSHNENDTMKKLGNYRLSKIEFPAWKKEKS